MRTIKVFSLLLIIILGVGEILLSQNCPTNKTLISNADDISGTINHQASVSILASNKIQPGARTTIKAGKLMKLKTGFHAKKGTVALLTIGNCNSGPNYLANDFIFTTLKENLDNTFYELKKDVGILNFQYREKYNDLDQLLLYNIYDSSRNIVTSNTDQSLQVKFGDNLYSLALNCNGFALKAGFYVLEVINQKREKRYLRFYISRDYTLDCS